MHDHHIIRVVVADRQALFRGAIATAVSEVDDIEVVGSTGNAPQTIVELARLLPDVVLVDMDLPGGARRVIQWARKKVMTTRVLAIAEREDENSVVEILDAGASGYLSRKCTEQELIDAIRATSHNDFVMPPGMLSTLLRKLTVGAREEILTTLRTKEELRLEDDLRIENPEEIELSPELRKVVSLEERSHKNR
jgi:two-component system NarL family response regulator